MTHFDFTEMNFIGPLKKNSLTITGLQASASYEVQIRVHPFGKSQNKEESTKANFTLGNTLGSP